MSQRAIPTGTARKKPAFVLPMQCKLVSEIPDGKDWIYEVKWDGYRALAIKQGKAVDLISRNEKKLNKNYPELITAIAALPVKEAVIDGEIVAIDQTGLPSFQLLQRSKPGETPLHFYAFDLLNYEGFDVTYLTLEKRKDLLQRLLKRSNGPIQFSVALAGDPRSLVEAARQRGLEGLVAKRKDSVYEAGKRTGAWIKYKTENEQEFVVAGFRSSGGARDFELLFVGYYEKKNLHYAAKVKAGFTPYLKRTVREALQGLETAKCPFIDVPAGKGGRWGEGLTPEDVATSVWVKPKVVCRVRFTEWTSSGHLRHAVYVGLRPDKNAGEVKREVSANV